MSDYQFHKYDKEKCKDHKCNTCRSIDLPITPIPCERCITKHAFGECYYAKERRTSITAKKSKVTLFKINRELKRVSSELEIQKQTIAQLQAGEL